MKYSTDFWVLINNLNSTKKSDMLISITIKFKLQWVSYWGTELKSIDIILLIDLDKTGYITDNDIAKGSFDEYSQQLIEEKNIDTNIYNKIKDEFKITNYNIKNIINYMLLKNRKIFPINLSFNSSNEQYNLNVIYIYTRNKIKLTYDDDTKSLIPITFDFNLKNIQSTLKNIQSTITIHYNETDKIFVYLYMENGVIAEYTSIDKIIEANPNPSSKVYKNIFGDLFITNITELSNFMSSKVTTELLQNINSNIMTEFKKIINLHQVINTPTPIS